MKALSARLREVIEKEPSEFVHASKSTATAARLNTENLQLVVPKADYDRLQKLALLLPECVEALERIERAGPYIRFEFNPHSEAKETLGRISQALEEMG